MAQTNKQKKRFIQSQNEQMVTPLTELTTSIELLRNSGLNAQQSGWLDHMYHAAQALNGLVQFSEDRLRIENHDLKLRAKAFNPRLLLVQQMDMFAPRIIAKALNYYVMIDPEVTPEMNGDAKRLSHVLRVLIENAITHTERGVIVVRVQRVVVGKKCVIRYSVTDTGEGLSEGKQKTLFTLAFNEGSSLHLARVIIREMGGELTFRSQQGRGSTFVVELPSPFEPAAKEIIESHYKVAFDLHDPMRRKSLHDLLQHANINLVAVEESNLCISDSSVPPGPNLNYYLGPHFRQNAGWTGEIPRHFRPSWFYQLLTGNLAEGAAVSSIESLTESQYDPLNIRVLLIDDNHNDRLLTKTVLEGFGCEIVDLDNGDDALGEWFLSGGTLNIVLVDCKMPGTDGYQTAEQLRQENCTVPIIGLTERRYSEEIDDAIRAGMTTCITKPVDHDELYHIILDCL